MKSEIYLAIACGGKREIRNEKFYRFNHKVL